MSRVLISLLLISGTLLYGTDAVQKKKIEKKPHIELKSVFQKAYGGTKEDIAKDSIALDDGSFIIAGSSKSFGHGRRDMMVTKFDKNGNPIIRATYGGKQDDYANALIRCSDGNFMAIGMSASFSKDSDKDLYVVKFDKNLKRIWQKTYGGKRDEEGFGAVATPNGGALIAGSTESYGRGYKDGYVLFIDKNGKSLFEKAIGGKDDDILKGVALSSKGGFFVAGKTRSYGSGGYDFYLAKFDSHGKYLYKKVLGGEDEDEFRAITSTDDGGCACAGSTESFESKHSDIDIMRFDSKGDMVWHKIYGFKSKEWANSITTTKEGGFVVAGTTKSFGFGEYDFYLLELNSKGSSLWANVYGGDLRDEAYSVKKVGKSDDFLVVGKTKSYGKGDFDFMYMKLHR